jgi:ADYC domain
MSPCGRFDPWPGLRAACLAAAVVAGPSNAHSQQDLSPAPTIDVVGTTLRVRLADGSTREGTALVGAVLAVASSGRTIRVRIAGVEPDASDPHGEILLYDFRLLRPRGEEPLCAPDADGRRLGFPLAGRSDPAGILSSSDGSIFELACTSGAQGKCARFGYAPWRRAPDGRPMLDWYNACVRLLRGDYCGDGRPFTRDGTLVDIYDRLGIHASDADPRLTFEAAWGPEGAVCVARTRLPDIIDLEGLGRACPRLVGRLGSAACSENVPGGLTFNRSLPGAPR